MKKIYGTREEARSDIFDYIEMFYNSMFITTDVTDRI
jgi:hypothetical protein